MADEVTKDDLIKVRDNYCDAIIDTENKTYYDGKSNEWVAIDEKEF